MKLVLQIIIILLAAVNLVLTRFALLRLHQPTSLIVWVIKVFISALSPILFLVAVLTVILGFLVDSIPAIIIGGISALLYLIHIISISGASDVAVQFEKVFGKNWLNTIPEGTKASFLPKRYVYLFPGSDEPIFNQDISFYSIPGTDRQLLCDVWQPPKKVKPSGLAFIYLHGSAWTFSDKDYGTRTFFRHLASQGHVIMDVAYRLFPEADFMGMVNDAKQAIAWMKANASSYGVSPDKIVIGGGSAGGHIAMLAAYTYDNKQFIPADLEGLDIRVKAVVSLYGMADLVNTFYHTCQHLTIHSALGQKTDAQSPGMPSWVEQRMGKDFHRLGFDKNVQPGMLSPILGGNPEQKPEAYALYSPLTHVHEGCPPTLIIQGEHDILAPLKANRQLHSSLTAVGVPVILHVVPQSDHAFDLILPRISPSAQNAIYDVERFLALMAYGWKIEKVILPSLANIS